MNYSDIRTSKLKNIILSDYIATSTTISDTIEFISSLVSADSLIIKSELSTKYCAEYFPEHSLTVDGNNKIYKTVPYGKIGLKTFEVDDAIVYTACVSQNLDNVIVVGTTAGVYISLDYGKTYQLFDDSIKDITAIREEKNFNDEYDFAESPEHSKILAFTCASGAGLIYYMILYLTDDNTLAEYNKKLFYITKYYIYSALKSYDYVVTETDPIADSFSLKTISGTDIGTVYAIEYINGKYLFAGYNGLYLFYIDTSGTTLSTIFKVVSTNISTAAVYSLVKYNNKIYEAGASKTIYSTSDGITWNLEYTLTTAYNINKLAVFNDKLVAACLINNVIVYDGIEWKESKIGDYDQFNSNGLTTVYIDKLRDNYLYMITTAGIFMTKDLSYWTVVCDDESIIGQQNQPRCIIQSGDNVYICGDGIESLDDSEKQILTEDNANDILSIDYRLSPFLSASLISDTYINKSQISDFMDSVITTDTLTVDDGYKWTFTVDDSVPYVGSTIMSIKSDVLPYNQSTFNGTVNTSTVSWTLNSMTFTFWTDIVQQIGEYSFSFRFFVVYNTLGVIYDSSGNPTILAKNKGVVQITSNAPDFTEVIIQADPVTLQKTVTTKTKLSTTDAISSIVEVTPLRSVVLYDIADPDSRYELFILNGIILTKLIES